MMKSYYHYYYIAWRSNQSKLFFSRINKDYWYQTTWRLISNRLLEHSDWSNAPDGRYFYGVMIYVCNDKMQIFPPTSQLYTIIVSEASLTWCHCQTRGRASTTKLRHDSLNLPSKCIFSSSSWLKYLFFRKIRGVIIWGSTRAWLSFHYENPPFPPHINYFQLLYTELTKIYKIYLL